MATKTRSKTLSLDTESLTPVHWFGVILAAVSGGIHLFLGANFAPSGLGISFLLAGLGFFGAVVLLLIDFRRRLLYVVGLPFVGLQIAIWYVVRVQGSGLSSLGTVDYVDKLAQVLLIVVLLYLLRTES